jgi:hypothetical protein
VTLPRTAARGPGVLDLGLAAWAGLAALAATLGLAAPACAADDEAAQRVQTEQKLKLSARLVSDPVAQQRIAGSGLPAAQAHLDEARVHQALAEDLYAQGDLAGARRAADDALRHASAARRLVPDDSARQAAAKQRLEQLLASVERLVDSARARSQPGDDGQDLAAALGLVSVARQQAQDTRYEAAQKTLAQAERHLLAGLHRTLVRAPDGSATLDYTERAATPAQAYVQALARHRGLAELLPIAVRDLRPAPEALAQVERYGETARSLEAQALQQYQSGAPDEALALLRNATLYVQRALNAAGLVAPTVTGSAP